MVFSIAKAMWGTLVNGWLAVGRAGSVVGGGNLFSLDMAANRKEEEDEEVHSLLSDLPLLLLPKNPNVVLACCINGGGQGCGMGELLPGDGGASQTCLLLPAPLAPVTSKGATDRHTRATHRFPKRGGEGTKTDIPIKTSATSVNLPPSLSSSAAMRMIIITTSAVGISLLPLPPLATLVCGGGGGDSERDRNA